MSKKIENLSYKELQKECARLGVNGRGTRAELAGRLDSFIRGDVEQKIFVAEDDNSDISPDEVVAENPTVTQDQILANNDIDHAKMAHEADWDKLKNKLDIIFAGRVQYFLQKNSENNYSVVFKGMARKSECINLTAGHKTIEKEAIRYVGRVFIAPPTGGDTPEIAMKKFEAQVR